MTTEQIQEFLDMFGDQLPDPKHYPRQFQYYVLLYKFTKGLL